MIGPKEIKAKVARLYPAAVEAWLAGDSCFFPRRIPANLRLSEDHSKAIQEIDVLRQGAKEAIGAGYRIDWQETNSRKHGRNKIPKSIWIDSIEDAVSLLKKNTEWKRTVCNVQMIRDSLPELENWVRRRWKELIHLGDELDQLIVVCKYIQMNPRPNCFVRELPVPTSTKLIEEHEKLIGSWLDEILLPEAIDATVDWRDFERRYGFRFFANHLPIRSLDPAIASELRFPFHELSLPVQAIAQLSPVDVSVVIVENKTTLIALPEIERFVAFGGLGFGVNQLSEVPWLQSVPIFYWGDLDVQGFQILGNLRKVLPNVKSVLMDLATLESYRSVSVRGVETGDAMPRELDPEEQIVYRACRDENLRIEQEKIAMQNLVRVLHG